MHYLDTNLLVYSAVNQDLLKRQQSQSIIQKLFESDQLLLSPLSIQELIFTLSKLKIPEAHIENTYSLFQKFCRYEINCKIMESAYSIAAELGYGKNINDVIHLKFAEKYCEKLITFDKDFKRLSPFSKISIEIITWHYKWIQWAPDFILKLWVFCGSSRISV